MSVMGKLNSSTEIIPIHGSADTRKDDLYRFKTNLKKKKQNSTYFSDPFIIPRVKQYLDENKHCDFIDTENITDVLQQRYREYSKRKRSAFKGLVEKAFRVILRSYNLDPGSMENFSGSSDDDIEPDDYHDIDDSNRANEKIMQLYMHSDAQKKNVSSRNEDKELINISSDEEDSNGKREKTEHKSKESSNSPKLTIPSSTSIIRNVLPVSQGNSKQMSKLPQFSISVTPQQPVKSQSWNMPPYLKQQAGPATSSASPLGDKPKKRKSTADTGTGNHKRQREIAIHDSHVNFANIGGMPSVLEANTTPYTKPQSAIVMGTNMQTPSQNLLQVKETFTVASQKEQAVPSFSPKSNSKSTVKKQKSNVNMGELKLKNNREVLVQDSHINFENIGGIPQVLEEICKLLVHIRHPEVYEQIGVTPPRGFLLHGPPGCGKTLLAMAIAGELDLPLLRVAAPELVGGIAGESEERIRDLFEQAVSLSPCILFLDEIDAITPNRMAAQREMERRIVAQLLSCLDELGQKEGGSGVLVIGATNRPDSLDPALRRAGRFDREVCLGIPNQESRSEILKVMCSKINMAPNFNYETVAKNTPGFVGADLMALMREAAMAAVNRVFNELRNTRDNMKLSEEPECSTVHQGKTGNDCEIEELSVIENESKPKEKCDTTEITIDDENTLANKGETNKKDTKEDNSSTEIGNSITNGLTLNESSKSDDKTVCSGVEGVNSDNDNAVSKHICNVNDDTHNNVSMSGVNDEKVAIKNFQKYNSPSSKETSLADLLDWLHKQAPLNKEQLKELNIQQSDFEEALKVVQPSAKREGFATVPDVTWDDVGSLQDVREELQLSFLAPIRHPQEFADLGLTMPTGVLLCGPPGCGKTLLAKAVANEAGINFISVKGPELLNMYVGESERAVRQCFQRAKNSAPCVIFFDELDSLCPKRSDSREGGASRVVNQMLTEMDGLESRKGVFLLAATNRPDIVDPAVLRPGRLDKILYVGLPGPEDRAEILNALTKQGEQPCLDKDVSLVAIAESKECEGYTGADLAALVREAGVEAFKDFLLEVPKLTKPVVHKKHFMKALAKIRPSVPEKDLKHYEKLRKQYAVKPTIKPETSMDIAESQTADETI